MTKEMLRRCRQADILTSHAEDLTDLKNVTISPALPLPVRLEHYMEQVKNPYLFRIDDLIVKVSFSGSRSLTAALADLMTQS